VSAREKAEEGEEPSMGFLLVDENYINSSIHPLHSILNAPKAPSLLPRFRPHRPTPWNAAHKRHEEEEANSALHCICVALRFPFGAFVC